MPFRSDAQRRYLFAKHPEVAKRFAAETPPEGKKLPERVGSPAAAGKRVRGEGRRRQREFI